MPGSYVPPTLLLTSIASSASHDPADLAANYVHDKFESKFERFADEQGFETEEARRKREEEEDRRNFWITTAHAVFASVTLIFSLASMHFAQWGITHVAFGMTCGTAPYTVRQRRKLNRRGNLRDVTNQIRGNLNRLCFQNQELHEENEKLKAQVEKLKKVEEDLRDLADRQGHGLDRLVAVVKENERVQRRMKTYLKASALQDIVTMVLKSDVNRNSTFDDDEIDELVWRMRQHPDLKHTDADVMRRKLKSGNRTIFTVLSKANGMYHSGAEGTLSRSLAPSLAARRSLLAGAGGGQKIKSVV